MSTSESVQMAGMGDGTSRTRPLPEPLRLPLPPARTTFVDGGRASGSPVAAAAARTAEATETPRYSVAFSVPASPSGLHLGACASVGSVAPPQPAEHQHQDAVAAPLPQLLNQERYHSQPALTIRTEEPPPLQRVRTVSRSDSTRDRRFDHFKTFSGRLERQLSNLRGVAVDIEPAAADSNSNKMISEEETDDGGGRRDFPTADRYFAALEGHELETLRPTEVSALPEDETWPFLLRFPINAFGMCLGVSSQAMLWKTLQSEPSTAFLHVSPAVNHALWWVSASLMSLVSFIYLLKVVFYFEAVRREFHHPIRVNFFFAPWIACLFLVKGMPHPVTDINHVVWYILMAPILFLDLKIYGQWMSGGDRRLSKVATPTNHLAVVGNFVGALLGAKMGLREVPIFFFAVGVVHYLVLFVTLYQRLPTNAKLPKELHPVFFLFIAAPSVASVGWARLCGEFNYAAKILYFTSLFLYMSLVVRINMFRGVRFSLTWWAYTFPMTSVAIATAVYASAVTNVLTRALAVGLSGVATVTVAGVLVTTVYRAFVRKDLFPNDVSIAVTQRPKAKFGKILAHIRASGDGVKDLVFAVSRHGVSSGSDTNSASESPSPMARGRRRAEP
ncbi:S-type anion channel SLAH2-like [Miscanthus floridulus]|uniref:S-type anion channel SLAH2-like n=1 Tax=Miscanthus floridulus TaxID=154761 RepID=UPI00345A457C